MISRSYNVSISIENTKCMYTPRFLSYINSMQLINNYASIAQKTNKRKRLWQKLN